MEESVHEALMLGVNTFIFIIALTAAILLLNTVLDMVNYANQNATMTMNGTLTEMVGVVEERIYSGRELLTYYSNQQKDTNSNLFVKVSEDSYTQPLTEYVKREIISNYLNKEFTLDYIGKDEEGKEQYIFTLYEKEDV